MSFVPPNRSDSPRPAPAVHEVDAMTGAVRASVENGAKLAAMLHLTMRERSQEEADARAKHAAELARTASEERQRLAREAAAKKTADRQRAGHDSRGTKTRGEQIRNMLGKLDHGRSSRDAPGESGSSAVYRGQDGRDLSHLSEAARAKLERGITDEMRQTMTPGDLIRLEQELQGLRAGHERPVHMVGDMVRGGPEHLLAKAMAMRELGVEPGLIEVAMLTGRMTECVPLEQAAREPIAGPEQMSQPELERDPARERQRSP